jgi:hypothetical protein
VQKQKGDDILNLWSLKFIFKNSVLISHKHNVPITQWNWLLCHSQIFLSIFLDSVPLFTY